MRQFHAKYWGQQLDASMTDLPEGMRPGGALGYENSSSKSEADPIIDPEDDQDDDLGMDVDNEAAPTDVGEAGVDEIEPNTLPEAGHIQPDVLPEARFIDTGNVFPSGGRHFFLRAEYIRIYNWTKGIYHKYLASDDMDPPVVVITGQPGVG
jgi:hypothetical protein